MTNCICEIRPEEIDFQFMDSTSVKLHIRTPITINNSPITLVNQIVSGQIDIYANFWTLRSITGHKN